MSATSAEEDQKRSLDVKLVGGVAWTAGAKWATQLVTWASVLVVAHTLLPADLGLSGMAGIYTNLTNTLAEFGIGTAVLHMPELSRKALGQLHTFSCLLCAAIFAFSLAVSPWIAAFFHSGHVSFFAVSTVGFLITGIQAVPMGLLQRDMDYRKLSVAEASMAIVQAGVTVTGALLGWGFWALMAGTLSGKLTSAAMVCSWKPVSFEWPRWADIRKPVQLGRQLAVSRVAWSAYTQADGIVIGRMLGDSALGIYGMALMVASAPAEKVSTLLMRTASPLFANVMNDLALVRRYYLIMVETLALVVMPLMLGLAMVAPLAVPLVLDQKWTPATGALRWLSVFMIFRTVGTVTEQALISQLMTRFTMRMSILNFILMPLSFIAAARWAGLNAVAAAWILLAPVTILPLIFVLLRRLNMSWREYSTALVPAAAGSLAMCIVIAFLGRSITAFSWSPLVQLTVLIAAGAATYAGVVLGVFRERVLRYFRFLRSLRKGRQPSDGVPA